MNRRDLIKRGGALSAWATTALGLPITVPAGEPPPEEPELAPVEHIPRRRQLITPNMIAREGLAHLQNLLTYPGYQPQLTNGVPLADGGRFKDCRLGDQVLLYGYRQPSACLVFRNSEEVEFSLDELADDLDTFSNKHIQPSMRALAAQAVKDAAAQGVHDPMIVMADLDLPELCTFKARAEWRGLSLRIMADYDINRDVEMLRFDVLYGVASREI